MKALPESGGAFFETILRQTSFGEHPSASILQRASFRGKAVNTVEYIKTPVKRPGISAKGTHWIKNKYVFLCVTKKSNAQETDTHFYILLAMFAGALGSDGLSLPYRNRFARWQ
jgi:hypothetical protein